MPEMDTNTQEELKAHLIKTDDSFRQLVDEHHKVDELVAALEAKHALSPEEEVEEHRLKKVKLHLKDQIEQVLNQAALQNAG